MPVVFVRSTLPDFKALLEIKKLLESLERYQEELKQLAQEQLGAIKEITDR